MSDEERSLSASASERFFTQDVPALDSGFMAPVLSVKYVDHALTYGDPTGEAKLVKYGSCPDQGFWPDLTTTVNDRDPTVDSVVVIWKDVGFDDYNGGSAFIGCFGGLTYFTGVGQAYTSFILRAFSSVSRNVFKHEWGHSILFYYDAAGTSPKPAVDNHIGPGNLYVHCGTGSMYILTDDDDSNPIPDSIYNNRSGFTHDYYSGTTAKPDLPNACLGIPLETWRTGGPMTHPILSPGDLNQDGKVDTTDINLFLEAVGKPTIGASDPRDLDYDGKITILDARIAVTFCSKPSCAP
jgi:hypothetical protein